MQCPRCNTKWPDEMAGMLKFCGACGAPLTTASNLTWQPPTTHKPGGELRFVTIVFADLAGFTSFAEERPPDEVARIRGSTSVRPHGAFEGRRDPRAKSGTAQMVARWALQLLVTMSTCNYSGSTESPEDV